MKRLIPAVLAIACLLGAGCSIPFFSSRSETASARQRLPPPEPPPNVPLPTPVTPSGT